MQILGSEFCELNRVETLSVVSEANHLLIRDSSGPHRVCVRKAYFSARMTGQVLLPRLELDLARKGHHLGPLMGIHCNPNTIFRRVGEPEGRGHFERLARLQEIASILATAQERGREGKEEVVARDGAWWGKRPDWWPKGGDKWPIETFVPDPAEEPQRNEIENQSTEKQGEQAEGSTATLSEEGKISAANLDTELPPRKRYRDSNRAVMAMLAGTRCRPIRNPKDTPRWNPLMKYDRTGAEASDWDNIFIVEGVFHHVTIIKARVHRFFVNFLETGQLPDPATVVTSGEPHSDPWWVLRVQRTKWFDLLKADDRVELLRTVWSVSAYLVRDKSSEVGGARQDSVGEQTGALKI